MSVDAHFRFRWFSVNLESRQLQLVGRQMLANEFVAGSTDGFKLTQIGSDSIKGRYIQRSDWVEKLSDHCGSFLEIPRVAFKDVWFVLSTHRLNALELVGNQSVGQGLVNYLLSSLGFGLAVREISIDPLCWANAVASSVRGFEIVKITTQPFELSPFTSASVTLSGRRDIQKQLERIRLRRDEDVVELVVARWQQHRGSVSCAFRKNGSAQVDGGEQSGVGEVLRCALGEQIKRLTSDDRILVRSC